MFLNKKQEELVSEFLRIENEITKNQSKISSLTEVYIETNEDKLLKLIEDYCKKLSGLMYEKTVTLVELRKTTT